MQKTINDININYDFYENKNKDTIVFLHGWGQNISMMEPLAKPFIKDYQILIVDLPGYGLSEEPKIAYSVFDYAQIINKLLRNLNIDNPIMIGHSFGGKISLVYASVYKVKKLVLLASPFKPEITKINLKVKILKALKKVPFLKKLENFAKSKIGSTDYKNATPLMREILVKTVNLDISEDVKNIVCPTLIIWGTLDEAVPVERAYELEKLIKDSGTVIYEGNSHYAYLERRDQTIKVINVFLGGN